MGKARGPYLPNLQPILAAGIDPATGLPAKLGTTDGASKSEIKKALRIIDEQDAVNRYVWYNLPCDLTSQELEQMLYYRGQLCFYYSETLDQFFFMPYALDADQGTGLDFYGRYRRVHPVPMTNGTTDVEKKIYKNQLDVLSQIKLNCVYGVKLPETLKWEDLTNSCVLIHDYTKQLSQTIIPRQAINDPILDYEAECIPYMQTNLVASSGVKGVRVNDADERDEVKEANKSIKRAALSGEPNVPIVGKIDFQELTGGTVASCQDYMLAMQSIDNFRLSTYGIDNGGLFNKKAHELQSEADINGGPVGLVMQDGLSIRQNFCNIVNSIWGIGIWCEPAQNIMGADIDGDGLLYDDNSDGANSGVETTGGGEDNE